MEIIKDIARKLIILYGLQKDWHFKWDTHKRLRSRVGLCSYSRKTISVSLQTAMRTSLSYTFDTLLHEIAHALTPGHSHDRVWKDKCVELGCIPKQCS